MAYCYRPTRFIDPTYTRVARQFLFGLTGFFDASYLLIFLYIRVSDNLRFIVVCAVIVANLRFRILYHVHTMFHRYREGSAKIILSGIFVYVSQKNTHDSHYYSFIIIPNIGLFSKLFHCLTQQEICNKSIFTCPIAPVAYCCIPCET